MMRAAAAYAATHPSSSKTTSPSTILKSRRTYHKSLYPKLSQHLPSTLPHHTTNNNNDPQNDPALNQYSQHLLLQSQPQPQQQLIYKLSTQQVRHYHSTTPVERGAAIVLGLGAVAATAKAGQYA
eukprot:CAMPEP_0185738226 /NCGR_PEP_ID=MMETSP1171-20130828/32340_1 /TAXON_ID=374046 /ORGANISM="Helicotheca tamensis, Strain CCMP826" /LENGTH=124 /DNA_ID=CAMNT_0028409371 /DNA_START=61 /DNA_END=432 /DNA_ORIENTATION=-